MGKVTITGTGIGVYALWPVTLPPMPLVTGCVERASDVVIRTDMDTGPSKVRMRTSAGTWPIQFEMLMSGTQLDIFLVFWETTIYGGSLPFEWTHPRTSTAKNMRFTAPPEWSQVRGGDAAAQLWRVGMQLEMLP